MKNILQATAFLCIAILISLNACQKDATTTPLVLIKDTTTIVKDTVVIVKDTIKPPVKGKKVIFTVREMGTLRPAANYPVMLFTKHSSAFYATFYLKYDSLGRTDAQGRFEWQWNGDSLPVNTYLGFSYGIDPVHSKVEYVGSVPEGGYSGWVLIPGVVRLKIEIKKDSLPFPGVELVQYRTGYYQQTPNWDQRAFFQLKKYRLIRLSH